MKKYRIVQVKSRINRPAKQKKTLDALGLTRMGKTVEIEASPQVDGMINRVQHLVTVEQIND